MSQRKQEKSAEELEKEAKELMRLAAEKRKTEAEKEEKKKRKEELKSEIAKLGKERCDLECQYNYEADNWNKKKEALDKEAAVLKEDRQSIVKMEADLQKMGSKMKRMENELAKIKANERANGGDGGGCSSKQKDGGKKKSKYGSSSKPPNQQPISRLALSNAIDIIDAGPSSRRSPPRTARPPLRMKLSGKGQMIKKEKPDVKGTPKVKKEKSDVKANEELGSSDDDEIELNPNAQIIPAVAEIVPVPGDRKGRHRCSRCHLPINVRQHQHYGNFYGHSGRKGHKISCEGWSREAIIRIRAKYAAGGTQQTKGRKGRDSSVGSGSVPPSSKNAEDGPPKKIRKVVIEESEEDEESSEEGGEDDEMPPAQKFQYPAHWGMNDPYFIGEPWKTKKVEINGAVRDVQIGLLQRMQPAGLAPLAEDNDQNADVDVVNDSGIPMEGVVEKEEEPAKQEEAVEEVKEDEHTDPMDVVLVENEENMKPAEENGGKPEENVKPGDVEAATSSTNGTNKWAENLKRFESLAKIDRARRLSG